MIGIKKIIGIVNEAIDKRARSEAKKVRRYERLESLGLRRLGSNGIKRKGEIK